MQTRFSSRPQTASPWLALGVGMLITFVTLGMRHAFGFFLEPMTSELPGVDRDTFGLAIALQNLIWGISQPFAGMIADRYGSGRVLFLGGLCYAGGLLVAAFGTGPIGLYIGFGGLVGMGLGCATFAVVLGAVGRLFSDERRSSVLGIATLGGAAGMFFAVPLTLGLFTWLDWQGTLLALAGVAALVCLAARFLSGRAQESASRQSLSEALREALRHRGFLLLVLGFFVCGFQLAFLGTHLPAYLIDQSLPLWVGGSALTLIGLANILGTFACGVLGDHVSRTRLLAALYTVRALVTAWFLLTPVSPTTTLLFAAVMGVTWLGTVPLTSGVVARLFGVRYLATLVGVVFFMHQVGGFLGAWLGGLVFERSGSYDLVWWTMVAATALAALIHLAIDEKPSGGRLQPARPEPA